MKKTLLLLPFLFLAFVANSQRSYEEAIQMGDRALYNGQYKTALNKYFSAEAFDPSKKEVVRRKLNLVFDRIEKLKDEAETAKEEARASYQKAQKLVNAFYFYEDRFALAFKNDKFYFIDKNGDEVEKLGQWEKAEQFDRRGFAKIKNYKEDYLLDTLGNRYLVAYNLADLNENITALDLSEQDLEEIPALVFDYPQLKILLLSSNKITIFPEQIKKLENLIFLDLRGNLLTSLSVQIEELKNLTHLNLSFNHLTSLPDQIGELKALTELDLKSNNITQLPEQIRKLKNLTKLDLLGNQLISLPDQIGELKNLAFLNLGGIWAYGYNRLKSLPNEIGALKNLTFLNLRCNNLTNLPNQFGKLTNLKSLYLYGNEITTVFEQIGELKFLTNLSLGGSKLNAIEIEKILKLLPNLKRLDLKDLGLKELPNNILNYLVKLEWLDFRNDKIEKINPNNFPEEERERIRELLPGVGVRF